MATLDLYLVRHGEAEPAAPSDALRGLTGAGRRHVRETGRALVERAGTVGWVLTSPLVRAVQTAEILANELGVDAPVTARTEIARPSSLSALLSVVDEAPAGTASVMMVGHEPTMGELAATILGRPGPTVTFRTGTVAALSFDRATFRGRLAFVIAGRPPVVSEP